MVNAIVFDFGDIFINKNSAAKDVALAKLGLKAWTDSLDKLEGKLETGKIKEEEFLKGIQEYIPNASLKDIKDAWNAGIDDFPLYRLEFLQKLSANYRLFLLSNTDPIHIEKFEHDAGASFYSDFYQCFEKVYFSHEIGVRKPSPEAFNILINKQHLHPKRTLFVDDKEFNTKAAQELGFKVWHLKKGIEDVVDMFDLKVLTLEEA